MQLRDVHKCRWLQFVFAWLHCRSVYHFSKYQLKAIAPGARGHISRDGEWVPAKEKCQRSTAWTLGLLQTCLFRQRDMISQIPVQLALRLDGSFFPALCTKYIFIIPTCNVYPSTDDVFRLFAMPYHQFIIFAKHQDRMEHEYSLLNKHHAYQLSEASCQMTAASVPHWRRESRSSSRQQQRKPWSRTRHVLFITAYWLNSHQKFLFERLRLPAEP